MNRARTLWRWRDSIGADLSPGLWTALVLCLFAQLITSLTVFALETSDCRSVTVALSRFYIAARTGSRRINAHHRRSPSRQLWKCIHVSRKTSPRLYNLTLFYERHEARNEKKKATKANPAQEKARVLDGWMADECGVAQIYECSTEKRARRNAAQATSNYHLSACNLQSSRSDASESACRREKTMAKYFFVHHHLI